MPVIRNDSLLDLRVNTLSARMKPGGSARPFLDLSQPRGDAVNEGIDPETLTCTYNTSADEAGNRLEV